MGSVDKVKILNAISCCRSQAGLTRGLQLHSSNNTGPKVQKLPLKRAITPPPQPTAALSEGERKQADRMEASVSSEP